MKAAQTSAAARDFCKDIMFTPERLVVVQERTLHDCCGVMIDFSQVRNALPDGGRQRL
jgi:hypothetical protein